MRCDFPQIRHSKNTGFLAGLLLSATFLPALMLQAQEEDPVYPKINVATAYEVDAEWPKRPDSVAAWDAVSGLAVDEQDRIWVFNRGEDPIQVYSAEGKFLRTWGRGVIGQAHHMKIDHEGNIWISDIKLHVVQKYTPSGELLLTIGTKGEKGCDETHLFMPTDMAITKTGDVFVADGYGNHRVVHFDKNGKFVKDWGKLGTKPGEFNLPHAIAVDHDGQIYVADRNNVRVQVFDQSGQLVDVWNNLIVPWGFYVTKKNEIWVCGSSPMQWWKPEQYVYPLGCPPKDQIFMKFNTHGKLLQLWTVPKAMDGFERPGECNWVHAIAEDSKGNLYVGDIFGKRAQKFLIQRP